ncbi:MAG TPA: ABC transporter substrate-binding protein [Ideonella sp.]|uniref:heme/hemin ABC transporter substrate-binding protein n=1 Tax=Ideonella sp. TaxID=1929293 RepID=UPI002C15570C|nr:ABC transporter substrate-binding protein [Ideonella sp.]HSI48120.1 ABC transporter substrate-binding protein [Ideonella sp.]
MRSLMPSRRDALAQLLAGASALGLPAWAQAAPSQPRIVAAGGAVTEMVYALGAEQLLAAVDMTSLYPEAARKLPSVGYMRTLSAEGVLAMAPTVLLATEDAGPPAVLRQIAAAGVQLAVLPAHNRFDGMLDRLVRVGELVQKQAQAAALAARLREDWRASEAQVAGHLAQRQQQLGRPLRALFVLSHSVSQVMVAGGETAAQAMLVYGGAVNAIQGFNGYKPLTPEAAIAAQPDLILATTQGMEAAGGVPGLLRLPGLAETPAGRAKRVVALEAQFLLGFGPRLPQAVRQLDTAFTEALAGKTAA